MDHAGKAIHPPPSFSGLPMSDFGFTWLYLALPAFTGRNWRSKHVPFSGTLTLPGHGPRNGNAEHRLGQFPSCFQPPEPRFGPSRGSARALRILCCHVKEPIIQ
jgi:hypothetical protein